MSETEVSSRKLAGRQAVTRAVVLAAGQGSRLGRDVLKPLMPVLGLPLLARTLRTLGSAGVTEAWVVLGHEAERVRRGIEPWLRPDLRVHWVYNEQWNRPNGLSVLAAADVVDGPFFLTMTDHVFDAGIADALTESGVDEGLVLAVDSDIEGVHDLEDATKVAVGGGGRIGRIGKDLERYDAIDTGVFLATRDLFEALREAVDDGEESLSAGVQRLADRGQARVEDVRGLLWQDIDTPEDLRVGRRKLLRSLRKPSDGWVARYLNRPVSGWLSSLLVRTPVTPNQVSVSTLVMSLLAAWFAARAGYGNFLAAGLLFHLASIVDGVDGEVAKLKFTSSQSGEWVDTVCDNLGYLAFLTGVVVGVYRSDLPGFYLQAGALGLAAAAVSIANLTATVRRERASGSFLSVQYGHQEGDGWLSRALRALHFMGKRDFLAFAALLLAVVGRLPLALPLFGVGATLLLLPATTQANIASWRRSQRGTRPQR